MPNIVSTGMTHYRKLIAWEKAVAMTERVYRLTADFPHTERFGLVSQMRPAAVSVPSNIAGGCGRRNRSEFARLVDIAYGSMIELETQLEIARRLGYASSSNVLAVSGQISELGRILNGLRERLLSTGNR